jgi:Cu2+-containing amine oxidase
MQAVNSVLASLGISTPAPVAINRYHPLDPLSPTELEECVQLIRDDTQIHGQRPDGARLWFKGIQLIEPPKAVLAPYLDEWHEAAEQDVEPRRLPRQADILVGIKHKGGADWLGEVSLPLPLDRC